MSFSLRFFKILLIGSLCLAISACGFRLRDSYNFPDEIQTLSVTSFDTYGNLAREMKNRLALHHIKLTAPEKNTANLHLARESYNESTLSLYQTATVAQRQLSYNVNYTVSIPNKGDYHFSTILNRSYLDNPLTALAKSVEEDMLLQEMRVEASNQIIRQLARLTARIQDYDNAKALEQNDIQMQNSSNQQWEIESRFEGKEPKTQPLSQYLKSN